MVWSSLHVGKKLVLWQRHMTYTSTSNILTAPPLVICWHCMPVQCPLFVVSWHTFYLQVGFTKQGQLQAVQVDLYSNCGSSLDLSMAVSTASMCSRELTNKQNMSNMYTYRARIPVQLFARLALGDRSTRENLNPHYLLIWELRKFTNLLAH